MQNQVTDFFDRSKRQIVLDVHVRSVKLVA